VYPFVLVPQPGEPASLLVEVRKQTNQIGDAGQEIVHLNMESRKRNEKLL
jgi:hypothetical protein